MIIDSTKLIEFIEKDIIQNFEKDTNIIVINDVIWKEVIKLLRIIIKKIKMLESEGDKS